MNVIGRRAGSPDVDTPRGTLRVEDCELRFENGEMSVTFRLSLLAPAPVPRRVPPRPPKLKK